MDYIQRTKDQYSALGYPPYAWVESTAPPPFAPLRKPLSESKCALVASGGIYAQGQVAFHFKDDLSVRIIDRSTPKEQLRTTHFAYDLTASRQDPGCVFPLQTLCELERVSLIGEVNKSAYTFMGGIYSSRRVREVLAPAIADRLQQDEVDVAVMVPVWPVCHQSVGLIAREVEARGIATVSLSSAYSITAAVNPPRAVYIDYPLGHTAGKPNDAAGQRRIMLKTLQALEASQTPGTFVDLGEVWDADDSWKDRVMRPKAKSNLSSDTATSSHADDRVERHAAPQYQSAEDALAAPDPSECASCLWLGNA